MKRRLALLLCGIVTVSALTSTGSLTAYAASTNAQAVTASANGVNPYAINEAENATSKTGRASINSSASAGYDVALAKGQYVYVQDVDFSQGLDSINFVARATSSDSTLEVRIDGNDEANTVATATIKKSSTNVGTRIKINDAITGKHDVYFVTTGSPIALDTWQARVSASAVVTPTPTPVVTPADGVNPYDFNEAENATKTTGRTSKNTKSGATELALISGGYVLVQDVDFSKGLDAFTIKARGTSGDSSIAIRIDGMEESNQVGEVKLKSGDTAGTASVRVKSDLTGKHDVYFVVTGTSPVGFDQWKCKASPSAYVTPTATPSVTPTPTPVVTPTPTPVVTPTPTPVVTPVANGVDPYNTNEAEDATKSTGRKSKNTTSGATELAITSGGYVLVKDVDFSKGLDAVTISAHGSNGDSSIAVRIDGMDEANQLGEVKLKSGTVAGTATVRVKTDLTGKHDLYFVVTGSSPVGFDSWKCKASPSAYVTPTATPSVTPTPTPVVTPTPTPVVTPVVNGVDPYNTNEAEDATKSTGRKSKNTTSGATELAITSGGYVLVKDVDFSKGLDAVTISARGSNGDSAIAVRIDGMEEANQLGEVKLKSGTVAGTATVRVKTDLTGKHDLYFVVTGSSPVGFDSWKCKASPSAYVTPTPSVTPTPTPVVTPTPTPVVTPTPTPIVTPVGTVNPYDYNEAEDATQTTGRKSKNTNSGATELALISGGYVLVKDVDFSQGLDSVTIKARGTNGDSAIAVRIDGMEEANQIGEIKLRPGDVAGSGSIRVKADITGKHDIYFVVTGTSPVGFDQWKCKQNPSAFVTPTPTPVVTPTPTPVVTPTPTPVVTPTPTPIVTPVGTVNPFVKNEAEDATQSNGRKSKNTKDGNTELALTAGGYVLVKNVDFANGASAISVNAHGASGDSTLTVRLDENTESHNVGSARIKSGDVSSTGVITFSKNITGTHDVYFVVTGSKPVGFDSWLAKAASGTVTPTPTPVVTPTPTPVVTPTPTPVVTPTPTPVVSTKLTSDVQINSWGTGYVVNIAVNNNTSSSVNGWKVKLKKSQVKIDSAWCVQVSSEGDYYVLTPESWNSTIGSNQGVNFGFQGTGAIGSSIDVIVE